MLALLPEVGAGSLEVRFDLDLNGGLAELLEADPVGKRRISILKKSYLEAAHFLVLESRN